MHYNEFDPRELHRSMRFALDLVGAHRVAKGLRLDLERLTAIRESMEERLMIALGEIDVESMPPTWSWPEAAKTLSVEIALQLIREQKNEPPDPAQHPG